MMFSVVILAAVAGSFAFPAENTDKVCILCPENAIGGISLMAAEQHKGTTYHVYGKANWYMAAKVCSSNGMSLVRVTDQNKNDEVTYFIEKLTAISGPYWTLATRIYDNKTWSFGIGEPLKYFNWAAGEPNNAGGNEQCIEMYRNGQWNDLDCSIEKFVLCEKS